MIEKLNSAYEQAPGLVDLFVKCNEKQLYFNNLTRYTSKYFGEDIINALKNNNILIGKNYGNSGIHIDELIKGKNLPQEIILEVSALTYNALSALERKCLSRYKFFIQDYMEGRYFLEPIMEKYPDHFYASSCSNSSAKVNIPTFIFFTLAETLNAYYLNFKPYTGKGKLALIPIHKPRPNRVELLHKLDLAGILDKTDWSLYYHEGEPGPPGNFATSYNVSDARWNTIAEHPFIEKYKSRLPVSLDGLDKITECVHLPEKLIGKYKWYVSCETYDYTNFTTEKTFKGMLGCMPVLTIADAGFNKELESLGFIMPGDYDEFKGTERIDAVIDTLNRDIPYLSDAVEHNFKLLTDKDFLCNLLVKELGKLRDMPPTRQ